jgi:IS30 family transposase
LNASDLRPLSSLELLQRAMNQLNAVVSREVASHVDVRIDEAMGKAEVTNALQMLAEPSDRCRRRTIADDKGFETKEFVAWTRAMNVTPHVAKNEYPGRSSALDDRTTRHVGHGLS